MQREVECEGEVRFGPLPWDLAERLAEFAGNWLVFAPKTNALMVRASQPVGCPAITAVPCELITILDSVPPEHRQAMPGGEFRLRSRDGVMRLAVEGGNLHLQWPRESRSQTVPVPAELILAGPHEGETRVRGWARFAGSAVGGHDLQAFIERFDALYPEEDMPSECEQNMVFVRFRDICCDPGDLVANLEHLADPRETLAAELEIRSSVSRPEGREFRLIINSGQVKAERI
jgi:hypothetical protein